MLLDRAQVDALALDLALVVGRTRDHAEATTRAVVGRDLHCQRHARHVTAAERFRLQHARIGELELVRFVDLHPDRSMRAHDRALATIDAQVRFPDGDLGRHRALLDVRGAGREHAIGRQRAHGQQVAFARQHPGGHPLNEVGDFTRNGRPAMLGGRHGGPDGYGEQVGQRRVDRGNVALHDDVAPLAVGRRDRILQTGDRLIGRQHIGKCEEARLHDRVDAPGETRGLGNRSCVDRMEVQAALDHDLLRLDRQAVPDLFGRIRTVDQHRCPRRGDAQHVHALEEAPLVHTDEGGPVDQVGAVDRFRVEPQVTDRHRPRLLRVVDEVGLHDQIGVLADDLGGVLVGADGAVGAEAVEHGPHAGVVGGERRIERQTGVSDVVDDADGELVAGRLASSLVEDRLDHRRGELLAAQPVATTDHSRCAAVGPGIRGAVPQRGENVEVQRFERRTGLLRAVEHHDRSSARGKRRQQRTSREGAEQPDHGHADALVLPAQFVDGLACGAGAGAHQHDHPIGIRRAEVVDEVVVAAGQVTQLVHRRLHCARHSVVERIARFAGLEEDVGVLGAATQHRSIGVEPSGSVGGDCGGIDHGREVVGRRHLDRGDLVTGAEAVEEVEERNSGIERRGVCNRGEVGGFLHAAGAQHREARGAGRHHVAVIAEDAERVGGDRPRGHVDHGRRQLAGDLEHVRQHQQQTLAGSEGRTERTPGDGTVQRARSTRLALHLDHLGDCAPQVGPPLCAPVVGEFAHRRCRCDRVDRDYF